MNTADPFIGKFSFLNHKCPQQSLNAGVDKTLTLAAIKVRQFSGKNLTARRQAYFLVLSDIAFRFFIKFPDCICCTSGVGLMPVKYGPIIRK
jgi:hypothetical protein